MKKILISAHAKDCYDTVIPLINQLNYEISLFARQISPGSKLESDLKELKKNGDIVGLFMPPVAQSGIAYHLYIKRVVPLLKKADYDIWLTDAEFEVSGRYIAELALPKKCKRIWMSQETTDLFAYHEKFAKSLIAREMGALNSEFNVEDYVRDKSNHGIKNIIARFKKYYHLGRLCEKIFFNKSAIAIAALVIIKKSFTSKIERYVYPLLLSGKIFPLRKFEQLTQIGDGRADGYIFFDKYEAIAHKNLFNSRAVYLSKPPVIYMETDNEKRVILGILNGWEGKEVLPDKVLSLAVRDFKMVYELYGADLIELRPHPAASPDKDWAGQLSLSLEEFKVNARVVSCDSSVSAIAKKYVCVAGFASTALRKVRNSNPGSNVVGFISIAVIDFEDPKFALAAEGGIDWVEEDGSFTKSPRFNISERKSITEIIADISGDE